MGGRRGLRGSWSTNGATPGSGIKVPRMSTRKEAGSARGTAAVVGTGQCTEHDVIKP